MKIKISAVFEYDGVTEADWEDPEGSQEIINKIVEDIHNFLFRDSEPFSDMFDSEIVEKGD